MSGSVLMVDVVESNTQRDVSDDELTSLAAAADDGASDGRHMTACRV